MTGPEPSSSNDRSPTTITDLEMDTLVHCATYLNLQDISNVAMTCKYLYQVGYSDSIWQSLFRQQWPQQISESISGKLGVRDLYLDRHIALRKFKFLDPQVAELDTDRKPCNLIHLEKNDLTFSQGPLIRKANVDSFSSAIDSTVTLSDHKARISCMRYFPISETSLFRSDTQQNENALVTSSYDHSIRLWWKGRCQRCFRGHSGPVNTISDKLLGDGSAKVFGSGGSDSTVRIWSLSSSGKRGQHALKATLYGHEKPVVLMSVAGHKSSLLVSMSTDSKVRVWDTTASCSSCCVGKTTMRGPAIALKTHESLIYVATSYSVAAVDLRTMRNVFCTDIYQRGHRCSEILLQSLNSFELLPSKSLFCTGGIGRATLWDIRRTSEPVNVLKGRKGPITHLHVDKYKIVTAGPHENWVDVWDTDSGELTTSFPFSSLSPPYGCSAMAVDGCRIVTSSFNEGGQHGVLRLRDYSNSSSEILFDENESGSKFWGPTQCCSDESDGSDYE